MTNYQSIGKLLYQRPYQLTHRELCIVKQVAKGLSNKQIGKQLNIADVTVTKHLQNIYKKLNTNSRVKAVSLALRNGILTINDLA